MTHTHTDTHTLTRGDRGSADRGDTGPELHLASCHSIPFNLLELIIGRGAIRIGLWRPIVGVFTVIIVIRDFSKGY